MPFTRVTHDHLHSIIRSKQNRTKNKKQDCVAVVLLKHLLIAHPQVLFWQFSFQIPRTCCVFRNNSLDSSHSNQAALDIIGYFEYRMSASVWSSLPHKILFWQMSFHRRELVMSAFLHSKSNSLTLFFANSQQLWCFSYKIWQRLVCVFAWTRSRHDLHTCFCPTTTGLVGWYCVCICLCWQNQNGKII